jgi:hypothetical protein
METNHLKGVGSIHRLSRIVRVPCVALAMLGAAFTARPAAAHARTITLIGSEAHLPSLHVIYLVNGRPIDEQQSPTQPTSFTRVAVPVNGNLQFTEIKAIPGLAPAAVELIALDTLGHLWSSTMSNNGVWATTFTQLPNQQARSFAAFDAVAGLIVVSGTSGPAYNMFETSSQAWGQPGWSGGGGYSYPGQVSSGGVPRQGGGWTPVTVTVAPPPCFSTSPAAPGPVLLSFTQGNWVAALLAGVATCSNSSAGGPPFPTGVETLTEVAAKWGSWFSASLSMPPSVWVKDMVLGYGNPRTFQMIMLGSDGTEYLSYLPQNGSNPPNGSSAWTWFGGMKGALNPLGLTYSAIAAGTGNASNFQLVGLAANGPNAAVPYLLWQDTGGGWHWYGVLPNNLSTASAVDLAMGHGTASTLQVGYVDSNGRAYLSNQDSGGTWTPVGPLP